MPARDMHNKHHILSIPPIRSPAYASKAHPIRTVPSSRTIQYLGPSGHQKRDDSLRWLSCTASSTARKSPDACLVCFCSRSDTSHSSHVAEEVNWDIKVSRKSTELESCSSLFLFRLKIERKLIRKLLWW